MEVYLPADRETGRPRGFAFVQFATEGEAAEAIRLFHDREVEGRKLTVNAAEDRPPPPGRPAIVRSPPLGRRWRPAPARQVVQAQGQSAGLAGAEAEPLT